MVRTRGGSSYRPRVRFSTTELEDPGTSEATGAHSPDLPAVTQPTLDLIAIPEEPQGFRRYQSMMGPWAPSQGRHKRARPSKQTKTSGPGESSRSRPESSPSPADEGSSPQISPASRIRRPMLTGDPIPGNIDLRARDLHGEPFYGDPRFRDSMRLIT